MTTQLFPTATKREQARAFVAAAPASLDPFRITFDFRRVNLDEGIRAGLSVALIVFANAWVEWPPMMVAALGAWLAGVCDNGGPIRRRVVVLLIFGVSGALITAAGGLCRNLPLGALVPLASLTLAGLCIIRIYGQATQQVGTLLSVALVLALDRRLDLSEAAVIAAAFLGGSFWSTLITMVIWRIHPYEPTRRALGSVFTAMALLARDQRECLLARSAGEAAWAEHARAHRRRVREALEEARSIILQTVRARGPITRRARQTLLRLESADQAFGGFIALTALLEPGLSPAEQRIADRSLRRLRPALMALARAIIADRTSAPEIERAIAAIGTELLPLPARDPLRATIERILARLRAALIVATPPEPLPDIAGAAQPVPLRERFLGPLRANWSLESLALRHTLRVAVMSALALAITLHWFGTYAHWLTITMLVVLQPYFAMTVSRSLERTAGTVLGGSLAALIGLICRSDITMAIALFPLCVLALSVRQVSYGLFVMTLTPIVVLLSELGGGSGESEWFVAGMRALLTVGGGFAAVIGYFVLWPSWEPGRLAQQINAAIAAHGRFAAAELAFLLGEMPAEAVEEARRAAGLASNNLEASLARGLLERVTTEHLTQALVIDASLRRLAGRLSLMHHDPGLRTSVAKEDLRHWRNWALAALHTLAQGGAPIAPRPSAPRGKGSDSFTRLGQQIELMAETLYRA